MQFDNGWQALCRPGLATEFFDLIDPPPLDANAQGYSAVNAWWLAELSRVIYRHDVRAADPHRTGPTRSAILEKVGLDQLRSFNQGGIACALVRSRGDSAVPVTVLVFRGTQGVRNWLIDLDTKMVASAQAGRVHCGFQKALDEVWPEVDQALSSVTTATFYTGHSMGGALATLAASRRAPAAMYTFGSPRVGDAEFASRLVGERIYRVVNCADVVAMVPPSRGPWPFRHVGARCDLIRRTDTEAVAKPNAKSGCDGLCGRRRWSDPPRRFADHAPVNYVARIERSLP